MRGGERKRQWKTRRLEGLMNLQSGLCYWCQVETIPVGHPGYYRTTGAPSGRAATIDHVFSKIHPLREEWRRPLGVPSLVMACSTCNGKRGRAEHHYLMVYGQLEKRVYRPDEVMTRKERRQLTQEHRHAMQTG